MIASAIENDVLRRRIKHRATADGFAKCLAEMAEARITDFRRGFRYIVASRAQQFGRAFHSQIAQVLGNSEADFARENPAKIKGTATDFLTKCFKRGRVRQIARQQFFGPLDAFARNAFLAHAEKFRVLRGKEKMGHQLESLALVPKNLRRFGDWRFGQTGHTIALLE